MKIILSKEDIEALVKKYYDMEAIAWNEDGTITIDTTLERIVNEKNDMHRLDDLLKKKNIPPYNPPNIYPSNPQPGYPFPSPYKWPTTGITLTGSRTQYDPLTSISSKPIGELTKKV